MSHHDVITIGHSPDPDDAFMVWALAEGVLHADDFSVALVARDIETLNKWALADARLEVTALSAATYARVADQYWLLKHGASFGDGYGPIVVAREAKTLDDLAGATVATPGEHTSAHAALLLAAPKARTVTKPFDKILALVERGEVDAGVLIHEGQITWERPGLRKIVDLGAWWKAETGLPLPLGVNAMRKDLGEALGAEVNALLRASIETGLASRQRALAYARQFGRGISEADADRFVQMYVNEMTLDMGETGRRALDAFFARIGSRARIELAPED